MMIESSMTVSRKLVAPKRIRTSELNDQNRVSIQNHGQKVNARDSPTFFPIMRNINTLKILPSDVGTHVILHNLKSLLIHLRCKNDIVKHLHFFKYLHNPHN